MLLIKNAILFDGEKFAGKADVLCSGRKIQKILPEISPADASWDIIDAGGYTLAPGFIDLHIHGAAGHDVMDEDADAIKLVGKAIARTGTTSWLPTSVTYAPKETQDFLMHAKQQMEAKDSGCAEVLGVHLEGPFISAKRKGAQNEEYILPPSVKNYGMLIGSPENGGDWGSLIRRVSLAPEEDGAIELIKELVCRGIKVSAGHTDANAEQFKAGIDAGLTLTTHFFNCMPPLHHRKPGVIGTTLARDDVYAEMIGDFVHLNPDIIKLTIRAKGECKCMLISDAMSAALNPEGQYILGGLHVTVKDGKVLLADGTIAGSIAMVATGVYNLISYGIAPEKVLRMASLTPAEAIGADGFKGRIKEGYDADLVLLDKNYKVSKVLVRGEIA